MAYTDIGNGGRIYDVGEQGRLIDILNQQEEGFKGLENNSETTKKKVIRYAVIGVGSVLVLLLLNFAVNKRKK